MSDHSSEQPRRFATRVLPWILAAGFFLVYLASLNHWISASSLSPVAQIGGWDGQIPFQTPLLWLLTRPLRLVPESQLPLAANILTAFLAAASVGLLARCVAIFPADRTHSQRIRGQLEGLPLDIAFNWVPPILAAGLLGFQLTFWEHATVVTGEMVNLFLFAFAARCLAQYRLDERDFRLQQFVFVIGLGCANDWSMVAYAPLWLLALCWTAGWNLLNARRLVTLAISFGFGLLLYLLMPIVAHGAAGLPETFGGRFLELLRSQKAIILGLPRGRVLLIALVLVLPAGFVSLRWRTGGSSGTDQRIKNFLVVILRLLWFGAGIWLAFDPAISPRTMVTLDSDNGSLALLTFSWVGALAVGVSAGWFLLVGTVAPEKKWERQSDGFTALTRIGAWACVVGTVAIPAALAARNWPRVAVQNGPIISELAHDLKQSLPNRPAIVISEDPVLLSLLQAGLRQDPSAPHHLLMQTRFASFPEYRNQLKAQHMAEFPALVPFAAADYNIAGLFVDLLQKTAQEGRAFYLNPPVIDARSSFILETLRVRPVGLIFQIERYLPKEITPPLLTSAQADALVAEWSHRGEQLTRVTNATAAKINNGELAAAVYSRAANANGVELQRSGRLVDAGNLFVLAYKLVPENAAALCNSRVNSALIARRPIGDDARKPLSGKAPLAVVEQFGPVDEPNFLSLQAMHLATLPTPLARAAAVAAKRAQQLEPDNPIAAEAFVRATIAAGEPAMAADAIRVAKQVAIQSKAPDDLLARLEVLQAEVYIAQDGLAQAEKTLVDAFKLYPDDSSLVSGISDFYLTYGAPTNSLFYLEAYLKHHGTEDTMLARWGAVLVQANRPAEAVTVLDDVLARRPDEYEAKLSRGAASLLLNKPASARADYEAVLKAFPSLIRAHLGLAQAFVAEKNLGDAQRHFRKVLELTPPSSLIASNVNARLQELQTGSR